MHLLAQEVESLIHIKLHAQQLILHLGLHCISHIDQLIFFFVCFDITLIWGFNHEKIMYFKNSFVMNFEKIRDISIFKSVHRRN